MPVPRAAHGVTKERVRALLDQGKNIREIGAEMGMSNGTVSYHAMNIHREKRKAELAQKREGASNDYKTGRSAAIATAATRQNAALKAAATRRANGAQPSYAEGLLTGLFKAYIQRLAADEGLAYSAVAERIAQAILNPHE